MAFFERRWPHSHVHPGSESFEKICDARKKSPFFFGGVPDQVDHSNSQESLVFLEVRPVTKTYISSTIPGAVFFTK